MATAQRSRLRHLARSLAALRSTGPECLQITREVLAVDNVQRGAGVPVAQLLRHVCALPSARDVDAVREPLHQLQASLAEAVALCEPLAGGPLHVDGAAPLRQLQLRQAAALASLASVYGRARQRNDETSCRILSTLGSPCLFRTLLVSRRLAALVAHLCGLQHEGAHVHLHHHHHHSQHSLVIEGNQTKKGSKKANKDNDENGAVDEQHKILRRGMIQAVDLNSLANQAVADVSMLAVEKHGVAPPIQVSGVAFACGQHNPTAHALTELLKNAVGKGSSFPRP